MFKGEWLWRLDDAKGDAVMFENGFKSSDACHKRIVYLCEVLGVELANFDIEVKKKQ